MPDPKPRPSTDQRITAALWFAARGFGVFPCWSTRADGTCRCPQGKTCHSPGKHPITSDGFKAATDDEKRIRTFLSAGSSPNYGLVAPEGVFILDVDGEGWRQRLSVLEAEHGALPPTLRIATAHGQHIFLRWPDGHPRPLRQLFGWVTRWGSGTHAGYVIGPRSVHASGFEYQPAEGAVAEIATLPDAWARAGIADDSHRHVVVRSESHFDSVAAGGRHEFLRDRARTLRGGGLGGEALFAAVMDLNERYCVPPKSAEEVRRAIGDVETKFAPDPLPGMPEYAERQSSSDDAGVPPPVTGGVFPDAPHRVAYDGLMGACVAQMAEGTDAALPGLLVSFLAVCGAMVPAAAYSRDEQTTSPFLALVGESSVGRKGTAMRRALDAARRVWQADKVNRVLLDGLNSGEALVAAMHQRKHDEDRQHGEPVVALVFEEEYASMIQSRSRDGSTLDPKMRAAFDGASLSNRKAVDSRVVPPPYWLPALAAITPVELRRMMKTGESQTGAANRWLYVPVRRRDVIAPDMPPVFDEDTSKALAAARGAGYGRRLSVADAVSRTLSEYGEFVIGQSHGVALDLVKRYTTLAFRIALIHAAVERSDTVAPGHLWRALALTEYARAGIEWVFGQTVGNRDADILLRYLQAEERLSNRFISRHIIRDPIRRMDAVDELVRLGYARTEEVPTRGRPRLELVANASARTFVTYSLCHSLYTPEGATRQGVTEVPYHSQNSVTEAVTEGVQKPDRSMSEGGQKGSPGAIIDQSTGEVVDATATWAKPCVDYASHRSSHRSRPAGWVCIACHPEEEEA